MVGTMDVIELTKQLIRINSITGNEHEIATFIASKLDSYNVTTQKVEGFGPNVIARNIPYPDKPVIILNCHMDTVEIMQGWDSDPFNPRIEDNRLYGLGACDMKAGCAIAMDAFIKGVEMGKNLVFCAVSDEEGDSNGAHVFIEEHLNGSKEGPFESALCLIPEDTDENIKLGARGRYVVDIEVSGCSAHGATPECGVNAIEEAAKIAGELKRLPLRPHPLLGPGSICILKISGGGDSLSVPDRCAIRVDRHTVMGEDKQQIMNDFQALLEGLDLKCSFSVSWMERETPFLEPYLLDRNNIWAQRFHSAYRGCYNKDPPVSYGTSVGDFNAFGQIMPTIVFGPSGENIHGANECVFVDSIERCRDMYVAFITDFK
jgi:acetylornithine deacetylase/succinyl-diaminopimelate desuccinylase-like protein